jgi:uncharacterized protein (DUF1778 family)
MRTGFAGLLGFRLGLYGETPYNERGDEIWEKRTMPKEQSRSARIEARISSDALAVVKRAAEIQGRSISDFVVAAAQEAAHRTIEETHLIRLSAEDQSRFVDLLLNAPEPAPALIRARDAHAALIRESP